MGFANRRGSMLSKLIDSVMFACPNCGQVGVRWETAPTDARAALPRLSNGFHFEDGRSVPQGSSIIVCDYCDEILSGAHVDVHAAANSH
jgi:hypothetical protein